MKIKLLSLTALIALIAFSSCKKSSGSGIASGEISATINDSSYTFKNVEEIESLHSGSELGFIGAILDSATGNGMAITLVSEGGSLQPKTYLDTDTATEMEIELELNGVDYSNAFVHLSPFKVGLGGYLQGTFSGKLYEGGDSTSSTVAVVSNGKFNFSLY
ncbi:MAG TPA: hypothetical protein VK559_07540 [Ferruginibacter sp.]|nr:hypothetical protein [Ferruginibacter sp.]